MLRRFAGAVLGVLLVSCDKAAAPSVVPSYLKFQDSIVTVAAGASIAAFHVEVINSVGQVASADTTNITLFTQGVLNGTNSKSAVNGVATFTGISFPQAGTYILRASATGLVMGSSNQFVVTP